MTKTQENRRKVAPDPGQRGPIPASGFRCVYQYRPARSTRVRIKDQLNRDVVEKSFFWRKYGGEVRALQLAVLWRDIYLGARQAWDELNRETLAAPTERWREELAEAEPAGVEMPF